MSAAMETNRTPSVDGQHRPKKRPKKLSSEAERLRPFASDRNRSGTVVGGSWAPANPKRVSAPAEPSVDEHSLPTLHLPRRPNKMEEELSKYQWIWSTILSPMNA